MTSFAIAVALAVTGASPVEASAESVIDQVEAILKLRKSEWPKGSVRAIEAAIAQKDAPALHKALDESVFLRVGINPEGRVRLARGVAPAELVAERPALFLIKIENLSGSQQRLIPRGTFAADEDNPFTLTLMKPTDLAGLPIEYRLLEITGSKPGRSELTIAFQAGQGSEDLGFRADVPVLFKVTRSIVPPSEDTSPCAASSLSRSCSGSPCPRPPSICRR